MVVVWVCASKLVKWIFKIFGGPIRGVEWTTGMPGLSASVADCFLAANVKGLITLEFKGGPSDVVASVTPSAESCARFSVTIGSSANSSNCLVYLGVSLLFSLYCASEASTSAKSS